MYVCMYLYLQNVRDEFNMSAAEFREFEKVVESNQEITNPTHSKISKKLERRKQKNELKAERKNICRQS